MYYILVRIVVRLEVRRERLVLRVQTIVGVFLKKCTDCLQKRWALMMGLFV